MPKRPRSAHPAVGATCAVDVSIDAATTSTLGANAVAGRRKLAESSDAHDVHVSATAAFPEAPSRSDADGDAVHVGSSAAKRKRKRKSKSKAKAQPAEASLTMAAAPIPDMGNDSKMDSVPLSAVPSTATACAAVDTEDVARTESTDGKVSDNYIGTVLGRFCSHFWVPCCVFRNGDMSCLWAICGMTSKKLI